MSQQQQQQQMTTGMRTEQHGNQVVHVRGDSDSNMEKLFNVLNNSFDQSPSNSLKHRNLPPSFFRPPEPKGHCPVNGYGPCVHRMCDISGGLTVNQGPCCGGHGRSVSSPAQLAHQTLQQHQQQPPCSSGVSSSSSPHNKQASLDGNLLEEFANSTAVRPNGWDKSQRYYLNSNWQQQQQQQQTTDLPSPSHPPSSQLLYPSHPPMHPSSNLHHHYLHHHATSGNYSQQQQQDSCSMSTTGWEQRMAQENELYYHAQAAAASFDLRMPTHRVMQSIRLQQSQKQQQLQQQQQSMCGMGHHHLHHAHHQQQHGSCGGRRSSSNDSHYYCLELQKLQRKKERLQQEQEVIAYREMLLNELVMQVAGTIDGSGTGGVADLEKGTPGGAGGPHQSHQAGGLVDGYLGGNGGQVPPTITSIDSHVRQNSTDSGLGGMGTAYSLPRSPEDYYNQMEEMSVEESGSKMQGLCYGGGNTVGTITGNGGELMYGSHHRLDVTTVSELADRAGGDAEQLVASLGEEYEALIMNERGLKDLPWM